MDVKDQRDLDRLRKDIADGTYLSDDKLDVVCSRIHADLRAEWALTRALNFALAILDY